MATPHHPFMAFWRQRVQEWYPDLYQRTYFVPPVFFNRSQYREVQVARQSVYVTEPPVSNLPRGAAPALQQSHVRDDTTQVKVLRCLHALSEDHPEVMFVITQLDFGDYLNKRAYDAAASRLPRPERRGDFDILIIHRQYGILVCEIKAVGDEISSLMQQQLEQKIAAKLRQAIGQLKKADTVLNHVVSDQPTSPRIQTTVMLPNVTTAQLQSVLAADPQLSAELCQCLGVAISVDPTTLCLTSDDLSNPDQWWQQLVARAGPDPAMTDEVYLDLISRFGGPATTVRVACTSLPRLHMDMRTEGEGVAETGWQFTQLVLHPNQLSILNTTERLVFLTGPPGCGSAASSGPPVLRFRDVFVLSDRGYFTNCGTQSAGQVQGLQQAGVPVSVVRFGDTGAAAGMAAMSGPDHVIATHILTVGGLERKVVVWVQGAGYGHDGRLLAMSRCTAQLVVVRPP